MFHFPLGIVLLMMLHFFFLICSHTIDVHYLWILHLQIYLLAKIYLALSQSFADGAEWRKKKITWGKESNNLPSCFSFLTLNKCPFCNIFVATFCVCVFCSWFCCSKWPQMSYCLLILSAGRLRCALWGQ